MQEKQFQAGSDYWLRVISDHGQNSSATSARLRCAPPRCRRNHARFCLPQNRVRNCRFKSGPVRSQFAQSSLDGRFNNFAASRGSLCFYCRPTIGGDSMGRRDSFINTGSDGHFDLHLHRQLYRRTYVACRRHRGVDRWIAISSQQIFRLRLSNRTPLNRVIRGSFVAVEVFDAGTGVEDDDAFAFVDLAGSAKRFERGKTGRTFRSNEEPFA